MTSDVKPSSRERLLEAAANLSYQEGFGIGVEALCKAAGVSKRSMYALFESKDELLAASLQQRAASYAAYLLPGPGHDGPSREQIMHVFRQLEQQVHQPDFHGCRYLSAAIELKDPNHPARLVAQRVKAELEGFFRTEALRGGADDPDFLARQLMVIFDGASARAGIGADAMVSLVEPTVSAVLESAHLD